MSNAKWEALVKARAARKAKHVQRQERVRQGAVSKRIVLATRKPLNCNNRELKGLLRGRPLGIARDSELLLPRRFPAGGGYELIAEKSAHVHLKSRTLKGLAPFGRLHLTQPPLEISCDASAGEQPA